MIDWPAPEAGPDWRDVRPVLDEELARLPEKLRAAVVLCELEDVPRPEAAARLGVPEGTLSSRLARGKEALRRRLVKRGITLSAVGVGLVLAGAARAAVPPGLIEATTAAAVGGAGSVAVVSLAQAEVSAMFWTKALKFGLAAVVLAAFGGAAVVGYRQAVAAEDKKPDKEKLQGEWKVTAGKMNGKDATEQERMVIGNVVFDGDKLTVRHDCDYKLDPTKKPKHIDVTPRDAPEGHKGKSFLGIYTLDGDEMKLHLAMPGGKRPTDFESKDDGSDRMLLVLKRVKK